MSSRPTGKRVQFYQDVRGDVRWTQYGANGRIVSASTEGFKDEDAAAENWRLATRDALEIIAGNNEFYKFDAETFDRVELAVSGEWSPRCVLPLPPRP